MPHQAHGRAQGDHHAAGTLGLGLVAAALIARMLTFGVSLGSGFVGGPIFPSLFIGGTAGVIVHHLIPGVPLGLAFTCLLAATVGRWRPRRSRWS